jgi:hypothetical protein
MEWLITLTPPIEIYMQAKNWSLTITPLLLTYERKRSIKSIGKRRMGDVYQLMLQNVSAVLRDAAGSSEASFLGRVFALSLFCSLDLST